MSLVSEEQAVSIVYNSETARRQLAKSMDDLGWSLREMSTILDSFTPIERMKLAQLLNATVALLRPIAERQARR